MKKVLLSYTAECKELNTEIRRQVWVESQSEANRRIKHLIKLSNAQQKVKYKDFRQTECNVVAKINLVRE